MNIPREQVYSALDSERAYRDKRIQQAYGGVNALQYSIAEWILFMEHSLAEARAIQVEQLGSRSAAATLVLIREVTAMGVACMEQHGAPRREG